MTKLIGYKSLDFFHSVRGTNLKRDLLYFDQIFIDENDLESTIRMTDAVKSTEIRDLLKENLNDISILSKADYIKVESSKKFILELIPSNTIELEDVEVDTSLVKNISADSKDNIKELVQLLYQVNIENNLKVRNFCSTLSENNIFNVTPILEVRAIEDYKLSSSKVFLNNVNTKKQDILNLVINKFPVPTEIVSWEELIDFKSNSDIKLDRLALINWISEMGNSSLSVYEIEQKMEYLMASYENALKKNKIKYSLGSIEVIVTTSLDVLENVVKLNWSKAAKAIFDLRQKNVDLLIGETNAPGREIAYLSKTKNKFGEVL